jgi:hypothetical protein
MKDCCLAPNEQYLQKSLAHYWDDFFKFTEKGELK